MNKKLFSWKALAGLTLLVAMGLTSCNQENPIDPTDPTGSKKPVTPSIIKAGDLTLQITASADIASLWAKVDADTKTKLKDAEEITVTINTSGYKLDGATIVLPDFLQDQAAKKGQVLNIVLNGNFAEAKKPLVIDLVNYVDSKVNFTLPAQVFDFTLNAPTSAVTLASAGATIGTFDVTANAAKNNAVAINGGVAVNAIKATGAILTNGGTINAVIDDSNVTLVNKNGAKVGNQDLYVKNIILTADATITGTNKDTKLNTVSIAEGKTLTFVEGAPFITNIEGLGNGAKVQGLGWWNSFENIASVKNVTFDNAGSTNGIYGDIFENVTFNDAVSLNIQTIDNVKFKSNVRFYLNANNQTMQFNNVDFAGVGTLIPSGGIEITQTPTKFTYQWDILNSMWVLVDANNPITAANKADGGVEVSSAHAWTYTDGSGKLQIGSDNDGKAAIGNHTVVTIVYSNSQFIQPENCSLVFDAKSTMAGAPIIDNNITNLFSWTAWTWDDIWFSVKAGDTDYVWKKTTGGSYILIKK